MTPIHTILPKRSVLGADNPVPSDAGTTIYVSTFRHLETQYINSIVDSKKLKGTKWESMMSLILQLFMESPKASIVIGSPGACIKHAETNEAFKIYVASTVREANSFKRSKIHPYSAISHISSWKAGVCI